MPYLSHSQCELWAKCPRRWYLEKMEHAPQAPAEALILGDAVHQALETDGREILEHGAGRNFAEMWRVFESALKRRLETDDPNALIEMATVADMLDKGDAIVRAYVEHLQPSYAPHAVEETFTVEIPGADGWRFTGRIDARVTLKDGTPALVDFKTGKESDFQPGKTWAFGAEHTKDQATAYLWADWMQGGLPTSVVFCIFPVESDGNGGYTCKPRFRRTGRIQSELVDYEAGLRRTVVAIEHAKAQDDFPVRLSKLCAYCGVRGSCPEGERHLIQINYAARVPSVRRQSEEVKP